MVEDENKAVRFDKMVREKLNDELGLFEKYEEILSEIRSRIVKHNAENVIDIGCGTGNLCGELSDKLDVLGIDTSMEMIIEAKNKYKNMKFNLGNFLDKPFKENAFDIVVTTYAFHGLNYNEKKEAIKNMLGYLKAEGKIFIVDFMFMNNLEKEKCKNNLYSKGREDLWNAIDYKYYTNLEELEPYINSLGCEFNKEHIVNFTWIITISK